MLQVGEAAARCFKSAEPPNALAPQDRAASPLRFVKKIDFDKEF
ncbi:MAG: hypothetical protein V7L04_18370 [Nostoc sp.]